MSLLNFILLAYLVLILLALIGILVIVLAMNTETKLAKKRGPKPSGVEKVVYYRRVVPALVEKLDAVLLPPDDGSMLVKDRVEAVSYVGKAIKEDDKEFNEIKKQLEAMTASYDGEFKLREKLELDLEAANQELENWFMKDESSKVRWLAAQWNLCKQTKGGGEYDQTQS